MPKNIYEEVEKLLKNDDSRPDWADEMLFELREIKKLLRQIATSRPKNSPAYYAFVDKLRRRMRADITDGKYPEIHYRGSLLGINFKGFIYDKETTRDLKAHEAFEVYRFLYENRDQLEKYIVS